MLLGNMILKKANIVYIVWDRLKPIISSVSSIILWMISSDWVESDDLVKPEISGKIHEKIIGDTKKTSGLLVVSRPTIGIISWSADQLRWRTWQLACTISRLGGSDCIWLLYIYIYVCAETKHHLQWKPWERADMSRPFLRPFWPFLFVGWKNHTWIWNYFQFQLNGFYMFQIMISFQFLLVLILQLNWNSE